MTTHKEILKTGEHGSTFGGNYLSTRAALEVLSILEEHKNSGEFDHILIMFEERLKEIADKYSNLFEKEVGVGFMRGLRVKEGRDAGEIINAAFKNRVIVLKAGRNTVRFLPVLTMTKEEMLLGFERFESALSSL